MKMRKEGRKKFSISLHESKSLQLCRNCPRKQHDVALSWKILWRLAFAQKFVISRLMNEWTIPKALKDDDNDEERTFKSDDIWIFLLIQDIPLLMLFEEKFFFALTIKIYIGRRARESLCLMNEEENCFSKIIAVTFYRKSYVHIIIIMIWANSSSSVKLQFDTKFSSRIFCIALKRTLVSAREE